MKITKLVHGDDHSEQRILLSFTGFHDPFGTTAVAGNDREGPVLSLIRLLPFDRVILFSTPNTLEQTRSTVEAIADRHPKVSVESKHFEIEDPTDYSAILSCLRSTFQDISSKYGSSSYSVATASGTPQMHASWILLAASGEIPARVLHARNVKFVTDRKASVSEIDFSRPEFPTIRSKTWANVEAEEEGGQDATPVIEKLGIVGDHPSIAAALQTAALFAETDVPVLITGESGTGKENTAKLIHVLSKRSSAAFVALNCAAIPNNLVESILFGHVKGAFTGATSNHEGKFSTAHRGTLFLDEVAELPLDAQAKLLRALQEGTIEPVGDEKSQTVDCRVIAATNCDLFERVRNGRFREDLYYRLHVGLVRLPPLRDRRTDIPKLATHFLDQFNPQYKKLRQFAPEALAALLVYEWPGNIRQLCNTVQAAAVLAVKGIIGVEHLKLVAPSASRFLDSLPDPADGFSLDEFCNAVRRRLYQRAVQLADGHQAKAAALLGCTPAAVSKFMKDRES